MPPPAHRGKAKSVLMKRTTIRQAPTWAATALTEEPDFVMWEKRPGTAGRVPFYCIRPGEGKDLFYRNWEACKTKRFPFCLSMDSWFWAKTAKTHHWEVTVVGTAEAAAEILIGISSLAWECSSWTTAVPHSYLLKSSALPSSSHHLSSIPSPHSLYLPFSIPSYNTSTPPQ